MVKSLLTEEGVMAKIHALSMTTHTENEFETKHPELARKYPCLGGSKFDKEMQKKKQDAED